MKKTINILIGCILFQFGVQAQSKWAIDPVHSNIQFDVTHLVVSTVTGKFTEFSGTIDASGDTFDGAIAEVKVNVSSIDTENLTRDKHLKEDDFFNAEAFPMISFKSTSFRKVNDKDYQLIGNLTIRDVTKEITISAVNNGTVNLGDKTISAFKANFIINRFDYKLKWDDTLDSGSLVVGEEVAISMNLELVKQ